MRKPHNDMFFKTSVIYLNYLYCHSFASLEDRFEKGVILSNHFSINAGRISGIDKTEILRAFTKPSG